MSKDNPQSPSESDSREAIVRTAIRLIEAGLPSQEAIARAREAAKRRDRDRRR